MFLKNPKSQIPNPKFEEPTFAVEGDWDQLARLFTNLVSNALQYTPEGGKVDVELQWVDAMNRLPTKRHGMPYLQVRVSDTGIGISKGDQERVVDKFFRSEDYRTRENTGTGLGLYVTMKLTRLIHADIKLTSELNKGSNFTIFIPNLEQAQA